MTETAVGIICGSFDINDLKECVGQDLNLRTPTGQDPEPCAFDQAWQPTHVAGGCEFVISYYSSVAGFSLGGGLVVPRSIFRPDRPALPPDARLWFVHDFIDAIGIENL